MKITKEEARKILAKAMSEAGISASRRRLDKAAAAFANSMMAHKCANSASAGACIAGVGVIAAILYLVYKMILGVVSIFT